MTVAAWQTGHAYVAGDIVNPTVANGHSYRCTVGGTSGGTEPTWVGRYQTITDGATVTWVVYTVITPAQVRSQLALTGTTGQYDDTVIGGYILDAIGSLEQSTWRFLVNRPGATYQTTSYGRPILNIPGVRSATNVIWLSTTQTASGANLGNGYTLLPDAMNTGVYTGIQFRPLHTEGNYPWWLSLGDGRNSWFDTAADNPFDPRNYAAGYIFTSVSLDTAITGDWGYEPLFEPGNFVHALEILSEWYVLRPPAILADSAITPAGGIVSYSQMPPEVQQFVKGFSAGTGVVSIG
jgi:hypothetical protein